MKWLTGEGSLFYTVLVMGTEFPQFLEENTRNKKCLKFSDSLCSSYCRTSKFSCNLQLFFPSKSDWYIRPFIPWTSNTEWKQKGDQSATPNKKSHRFMRKCFIYLVWNRNLLSCSGNYHKKQVALKRNVCILVYLSFHPTPCIVVSLNLDVNI